MILGIPFARYWLQGGAKVSLKRYFLRRITRLEPPYIAALLLIFMAKDVGHRGTIAEMLPHLGVSLMYLHNLIYSDHRRADPADGNMDSLDRGSEPCQNKFRKLVQAYEPCGQYPIFPCGILAGGFFPSHGGIPSPLRFAIQLVLITPVVLLISIV